MVRKHLLDFDGMKFRAKIKGEEVTGIIRVENDIVYLCQNKQDGAWCKDRGGFRFSWKVGTGNKQDLKNNDVTDFYLLQDNSLDLIDAGDEFKDGYGNLYRVITCIGAAVITECNSKAYVYSINELKEMGATPLHVKWPKDSPKTEFTMSEIVKLIGVLDESLVIGW